MDFLKSWIKTTSNKTAEEPPQEPAHEARPDHPPVVLSVTFE